jgi:hypothetical protein
MLALLLLGSGVRAQEAPASSLPAGVTPLPAASAKHLDDLLHEAEKYRGLKAKRAVPSGSLSPKSLKKRVTGSMEKDYRPEELKAMEVSLKAFGLIPETLDLRRYIPELLGSQVAGFYDPDRKYLALVNQPESPAGKPKPKVNLDMILVHELTHGLQDQNFDLHRFEGGDPMADAGSAGQALVEGDASLTMMDFSAQTHLEAMPGVGAWMEKMMRDPGKLMAASPDFPGAREMSAAPAWFRDTLLFSYLQGAAFCMEVRQRGGQKLLDYAFTTDPPRSTEQILHPEKWYGRRDDPVVLQLPDLAKALPDHRKAAEGEMGELGVRILLRGGIKDRDRADAAAAGWGGDRFAVYEREGGRLIVWITEWDTDADAGEFRSALGGLSGWRVEPAGPTRVLAVRGNLPDGLWAGARAPLGAAAAERLPARDIDLKAVGAAPMEWSKADMEGLLKNPTFQEGLKKARDRELPAGELSADDRIYTNPALSFSIRVPESLQGWKVDAKPSSQKQTLVTIASPDLRVHLAVTYMELPPGMPADGAGGLLEMAVQAMVAGYSRVRQERVERGGLTFEDTWFTAEIKGNKVEGLFRYLARGSRAFLMIGAGQVEPWARQQAAALQILDTFTLLDPKSGTP